MDKIAEIAQTCLHVAVQLKLQAAFGLRVKRVFWSVRLRVRNVNELRITRGTRRSRAGRAARCQVSDSGRGSVAVKRLYRPDHSGIVYARSVGRPLQDGHEKHGVTKKCGSNGTGLRHQHLQELYERVAGVAAPIKGSGTRPDASLHEEAMKRVVEAAGHSRVTKANAYLSTFALQERMARRRPTDDEIRQALADAGGNKSHAANALGISRQALYRALSASEN